MKDFQKWLYMGAGSVIGALGLYILYRGAGIVMESQFFQNLGFPSFIQQYVEEEASSVWLPGLTYEGYKKGREGSFIETWIKTEIPLYDVAYRQVASGVDAVKKEATGREKKKEDTDENEKEEQMQNQPMTEIQAPKQTEIPEQETVAVTAQGASDWIARDPVAEIPYDQLGDFNFLLNQYYIVDDSTSIDDSLLNAENFLEKDFSIVKDPTVPQILIYHTHSQEEFVDSVPGDDTTTIVGVGDYLTELLEGTYGYQVIHDRGVYDLIDGVLDRDAAYDYSLEAVEQILAENPSIEVVIDLHRDGVDGKRLVTEINGEETAPIMLFNGLSRLADGQEIDYLPNPYLEENLAFSFQIQLKAEQFYPDLMRPVYLRGYRYNLHVRPRTLLVEAGTQLNTLQEEKNAMKYLAQILDQVLSGK
ncbi:MAG: stage II sporulation protein P [Eubacteriales bacterium]|nr:stage II sporulation protein P [Eubacteriales bacterium]